MKKIVSILKVVLQIGAAAVPSILQVVLPGIGDLVLTILNAALNAEAKYGAGTGAQKAAAVTEAVNIAAPALVSAIERQTGKELADEALFASGVAQVQEGMVAILNAFRVLPKA